MQSSVRMTAALRSAWNVIQVIHTFDLEGNVALPLDEGQVSARLVDLWKVQDAASVESRHD